MTNPNAGPPVTKVDPDRPCPHMNFAAMVEVNRITRSDDDPTIVAFSAEITIECDDCHERFRFNGVDAGLSQARPMCSPDERRLFVPIRPESADPDFGLGLPGYAIHVRQRPDA